MINKFQQGGKQDAVMQFVQGLAQTLQADPQQVIQIAQQNPQALEAAIQTYQQTKDIKQAAQTFQQAVQQQTRAARHGAKLNYIKSLKNQCAEDEEVVYYKKGGSVGCGCKKKEDGGEIKKEQKGGSVVDRFKRKVKEEKWDDKKDNKLDSLSQEEAKKTITPQGKKDLKSLREKFKKSTNKKDYEVEEGKCGGKVKKHQEGSVIERFKTSLKNGGSLNGIPFMQNGTPKGGLPTAPKAEDRYRTSIKQIQNKNGKEISTITSTTFGYQGKPMYMKMPATIQRIVEHGDTAFIETPEHHTFTNVQPRTAFRGQMGGIPYYSEYNPKGQEGQSLSWQNYVNNRVSPKEYETLKRRFNTAWNLAK